MNVNAIYAVLAKVYAIYAVVVNANENENENENENANANANANANVKYVVIDG